MLYFMNLLSVNITISHLFAFNALTLLVGWQKWHPAEWWGAGQNNIQSIETPIPLTGGLEENHMTKVYFKKWLLNETEAAAVVNILTV